MPKGDRLAATANEIGVDLRTFARWVSRYEKGGEVALLSAKALRSAQFSERFELFEQVALDVIGNTPTCRSRLVITVSRTLGRVWWAPTVPVRCRCRRGYAARWRPGGHVRAR
ncbi:MAG TPA: helix-turn-helix domain-containing protein [Mycobacterium sp.]|nr:helix-turn-helix domain-containing protein [Mycobacterium sp.]